MEKLDTYLLDNAKKPVQAADYSDDQILIFDNIKAATSPSPVRSKMNCILICVRGKISFNVNGRPIMLEQNDIFLSPPETSFTDYMCSPDLELKLVCMTNAMMLSFLHDKMTVWNEMMYIHKMHVIKMDPDFINIYVSFYNTLKLCMSQSTDEQPYKSEVVRSLLCSICFQLCGVLKRIMPEEDAPKVQHGYSIFQQFLELLSQTSPKRRTVEYYAEKLCITPKYLSAICKKNSGKTAGAWITEQVLEDIRYYLTSTDLSIKQIGTELRFPTSSFFGKYVREHFGMTPSQLRKNATKK